MEIKIGTDIVHIAQLQETVERNRWKFERDVFFDEEIGDGSPEHAAGIFAAKEATMKALGLRPGEWKSIKIYTRESGRPQIQLIGGDIPSIESSDLSISHSGDYAIATAVFVLR